MNIVLFLIASLLALPQEMVGQAGAAADDFVKQKNGVVVVKDKTKPVRRELEAVFAERVRATLAGDGDALAAMVHLDYTFVMPDGQEVGQDWLVAYLRHGTNQFIEIRELSITAETIHVRPEAGELVAVVEARQRFSRTQRLADGKVHEVFSTVLQDETWVRVGATPTTPVRWQLRSTANLREQQITVDGQPRQQFGG